MSREELVKIINRCRKNDRNAQKVLYQHFYNYGMTVCYRYARDKEEAKEMLNDAFVKVFTKLDKYSNDLSFKGWFNKILVNTAIDHFRKNQNLPKTVDISNAYSYESKSSPLDDLSIEEIFKLVQNLSPAYRVVFNLYVVEGHKHHEIAEKLGISVGASKSNLAKARRKLQAMIIENNKISKYAG